MEKRQDPIAPSSPQQTDHPTSASRFCVFKLGGSLLDLPGLTEKLLAVIGSVSAKPLLVPGGGRAADLVRDWDKLHALNPSTAHWLAVQAMTFNAHLLQSLLPGSMMAARLEQAEDAWRQGGIVVLDAFEWLQSEETQSERLPHSWSVTSDSIAAWAAIRWGAEGLVLLKSADWPEDKNLGPNAWGLVDEHFPQLVSRLPPIGWCNLRSTPLEVAFVKL